MEVLHLSQILFINLEVPFGVYFLDIFLTCRYILTDTAE